MHYLPIPVRKHKAAFRSHNLHEILLVLHHGVQVLQIEAGGEAYPAHLEYIILTCVYIYIYTNTHTQTHTHTHAQTHTDTHTDRQTNIGKINRTFASAAEPTSKPKLPCLASTAVRKRIVQEMYKSVYVYMYMHRSIRAYMSICFISFIFLYVDMSISLCACMSTCIYVYMSILYMYHCVGTVAIVPKLGLFVPLPLVTSSLKFLERNMRQTNFVALVHDLAPSRSSARLWDRVQLALGLER